MKRKVLLVCYYLNLLMIIFFVLIVVAGLLKQEDIINFFFLNSTANVIRMLFSIPVFYLWFNCLVIWSKYDKRIGQFFLLFFLIGTYSPFYFKKHIRTGIGA